MYKVYVNQTGGLPFTTNILNTMQNAYNIFNALGNLAGNHAIILGCEETGNAVSEGVVNIDGELLLFKGGTKISKVRIVELEEAKRFEDGTNKVVIIKRYVEFGTASNDMLWSDFKRPEPLLVLTKKVEDLITKTKKIETRLTKTVPIGLVAIWDRPAIEIPEGWEEHIELREKKPLGHNPEYEYKANSDVVDYKFNVLGYEGGDKQEELNDKQMARHKHSKNDVINKFSARSLDLGNESSPGSIDWGGRETEYGLRLVGSVYDFSDATEQYVGEGKPHNNMDPYRVVKFIRFVGFN